jgi:hypothetical protein
VPITTAQIKLEFPEFFSTSPALIDSKILDAYALLSAAAFGDVFDMAVKHQVCHLIAMSPAGEFARLDTPDKDGASTTYERHLNLLKRSIAGPMAV